MVGEPQPSLLAVFYYRDVEDFSLSLSALIALTGPTPPPTALPPTFFNFP